MLRFVRLLAFQSCLLLLSSPGHLCSIYSTPCLLCYCAFVDCDALRLHFAIFAYISLLLLLVGSSVVGLVLSYLMLLSLFSCRIFAVFIPLPCVSASCDLFPYSGDLVFFSSLESLFLALLPVSLVSSSLLFVWCSGFCGPFASFRSPVPFATWSPFGTSQGLMFPMYRLVFWFQSCVGLPWVVSLFSSPVTHSNL